MEPTDDQLAMRAAAGEAEAFATLVDRHYGRCLRYATRMLGDRADAEDAVQEMFVRAYRGLGAYEPRGRFERWLRAILINRCRTAAARRKRRRIRRRHLEGKAADRVQPSPVPDGAALERIQRALLELAPDHREAFLLKYVESLTYDEMSEITGAGISALKMRVKRARDRLEDLLGDLDD